MKKSLFLLASLSLGTAAIAQDAPAPQTPPAAMPDAAPPAATTPAPDASAMPAPATTSTPDAGATPAPTAAATDDSSLPFCSRTVTDKCKQHEGGAHKAAHKKHK